MALHCRLGLNRLRYRAGIGYGPMRITTSVTRYWKFAAMNELAERTDMKTDLVQTIKDNPNAVAVIDNDGWGLYRETPENNPYDYDDYEAYNAWEEKNRLADENTIQPLGDGGYGSGNFYGGDILQALAQIVGLKVRSV